MSRHMMLLINPHAGKGGYKSSLAAIAEAFSRSDWLPTIYFTKTRGDAREIVEKEAGDYEMVVCLGGDGTLSEVTSGMMLRRDRRPIGYIPLGTANDVAHTLALSADPAAAAEAIVRGNRFPLDIGQFGQDGFFTYIAAFGAFTEVSYATPQEAKQALGHLAYMLEGLRSLNHLNHYHAIVEYDDGVVQDDFIFGAVTNSTSIAGLLRLDENRVNLADGMFELLLVKTPQNLLDHNSIITAILSHNFSAPNVLFLRSKEVRILFDEPVAWTRDGEDGGSHRDVLIFNRHPGVELIV